jgi:hypothetical protein
LAPGILRVPFSRMYGFELLRRQSGNCTQESVVSVNATLSCAPSPEPFAAIPIFSLAPPVANNASLTTSFSSGSSMLRASNLYTTKGTDPIQCN